MIELSNLSDVLPKHLTDDSYNELRDAVRRFPEIAYDRFYSNYNIDPNQIYQGDCLTGLPFSRQGKLIEGAKCFILSNTCDIEISANRRYFNSQIVFSPIFDPEPYIGALKAKHPAEPIDNHFADIRRQKTTQIMYLPPNGAIPNGGIVFLDQVYHVLSGSVNRAALGEMRLFTLSNYGHYCMSIKLSHHFCRLTAKTDKPFAAPEA